MCLFISVTDSEFIGVAQGRIIADIAVSTVALGLCLVCLVLLLVCWKKGDKYKMTIYSSCEYAILVGPRSTSLISNSWAHPMGP